MTMNMGVANHIAKHAAFVAEASVSKHVYIACEDKKEAEGVALVR